MFATGALSRANYFFDCEFNEAAKGGFCGDGFISIGMVSEDNRQYYAVNKDHDHEAAMNDPWLAQNVMAKLPPRSEWKDIETIRAELADFIKPADYIEF